VVWEGRRREAPPYPDQLQKCCSEKYVAVLQARGALTEEEQETVAKEIVEHLELSNWKIEQGPPLGGHGPGLTPKA
jgi:hypothetical protein